MKNGTWVRGYIFHPDPDYLVALSEGCHDYETEDDVKDAFIRDELSVLEMEAVCEDLFR